MNEETLRKALVALECDAQITRILLEQLIAQAPAPELLLQNFRAAIDSMTIEAPSDIDPEQVVELRARAAQTELLVRQTLHAANGGTQSSR